MIKFDLTTITLAISTIVATVLSVLYYRQSQIKDKKDEKSATVLANNGQTAQAFAGLKILVEGLLDSNSALDKTNKGMRAEIEKLAGKLEKALADNIIVKAENVELRKIIDGLNKKYGVNGYEKPSS